jgi:hypothetical protein
VWAGTHPKTLLECGNMNSKFKLKAIKLITLNYFLATDIDNENSFPSQQRDLNARQL